MVFRPSVDRDLCFVLMPFREPFNGYYEHIIKPAVIEAGLRALRGDEVYGSRAIIRDVWDSIWRASVIVADVTDRNPNVNYELGLAHALGVPTVLLSKREADVPFDYRHRRFILYETDLVKWESRLRESIVNNVREARKNDSDEELPWPYVPGPPSTVIAPSIDLADPRALVVRGVRRVRETVAAAFGPLGGAIASRDAKAMSLRRGSAIVEAITGSNPLEQRGVAEMQQGAREQLEATGDGTKLAVLLAAKLIEGGDRLLRAGHARAPILSTMRESIDTALAVLVSHTREVAAGDLDRVAVSAGGDDDAAHLAAGAVEKLGIESSISVSGNDEPETTLVVWEGMRVDAGYASEHLITDIDTKTCSLENAVVLLNDQSVSSMPDLLPILEETARSQQPLVLFGAPVEGEALATLVVNKLRGTLACVAVNLPARGRADLLTDIAVYCGGTVVRKDLGMSLRNLRIEDLGRVDRVIVDRSTTQLIGGRSREGVLEAHLQSLRNEIAAESDGETRAYLRNRLLRLKAVIGVISVGGRTRLDINESRSRAEAALASCTAAAAYGVVAGGGVCLLAAADEIRKLQTDNPATNAMRSVVAEALDEVIQIILRSANADADVMERVRDSRYQVVFDAVRGDVRPADKAPVMDAALVLRRAIEIAHVHAKRVLETISWDIALLPQADNV